MAGGCECGLSFGTLSDSAGFPCMRNTERKAKAGMSRFVVTIFVIAIIIAGFYIVFWTPGEPEVQPTPNAINRSE